MPTYDTDGPVTLETLFGLPHTWDEAGVIVTPVPFDATASYRAGSARGPEAMRRASAQLDLLDPVFGEVHEVGIHMTGTTEWMPDVAKRARELAIPIIEEGGPTIETHGAHDELERLCAEVEGVAFHATKDVLDAGKKPVLLGGEHGVALGAIVACVEHARDVLGAKEVGVLQLDAHRDLRDAYLGMTRSHASVMRNALERLPEITRLVQVGIRDAGVEETAYAHALGDRVVTTLAHDLHARLDDGERYADLCARIVEPLPEHVYVTFDIDVLEPSLCPHTGTPVPGGLSFQRAVRLLKALADSGRTVIGADLVEVAPGRDGDEWDANVGMRVLYALIGCITRSPGEE
ncbi:MAG: agmatinase family protein [Phycisphaerales bacterium]